MIIVAMAPLIERKNSKMLSATMANIMGIKKLESFSEAVTKLWSIITTPVS